MAASLNSLDSISDLKFQISNEEIWIEARLAFAVVSLTRLFFRIHFEILNSRFEISVPLRRYRQSPSAMRPKRHLIALPRDNRMLYFTIDDRKGEWQNHAIDKN